MSIHMVLSETPRQIAMHRPKTIHLGDCRSGKVDDFITLEVSDGTSRITVYFSTRQIDQLMAKLAELPPNLVGDQL